MIKQIWEKYQNLAIAKKMLVLSLIVSIGPILCILLINYQLSARVMREQTGELIQANLEQNAVNLEDLCRDYEKIVQGIYTDEFYTEELKPINRWDHNERYAAEYAIEQRLEDLCYNNFGILGIAIVGEHYDTCFYDTVTQSGESSFCFDFDKIRQGRLMARVTENKGMIYTPSIKKSQGEYESHNCIYMIHQLTDFSEYQKGPVGCIILCFDEAEMRETYGPGNVESNLSFVADKEGNVISFPLENWSPEKLEVSSGDQELDQEQLNDAALNYAKKYEILKGGRLEVRSMSILNGQFYVINIQDFDYAIQDFTYITMIIILVGLLTAILCVIFALNTAERVDGSLQPILKAMDKANRGDAQAHIEDKDIQGHEFVRISRHFNKMIQNIWESRRLEREALIREKNAEIKALEAQINPHFLYNTLDAINWLAVDREEYTISKMLTSLAALLRYSIHKSNEIVPLESELVYLRQYIHLQQQRMNYSFVCSIKADEELNSVRIHKMLIQPLLENTLVHGFPGKSGIDEIKINICRIALERMQITVEDNGVGMSRETVEMFNHYDYARDRIESSIGLRNVIARLKLYYGENSSFFVESNENGTKITMEIPCGDLEEKQ